MKNKLFLEEGEISRILNMHKRAIREELNVNGDEVVNNKGKLNEADNPMEVTLPVEYFFEPRDAGFLGGNAELKMFKGAKFKIDGKGILKSNTKYQFVDTVDGSVYIPGQDIPANYKIKVDGQGTITGTITYVCGQGKFYTNYNTDYLLYDEDGKLVPYLTKLCQASNIQQQQQNQQQQKTGGGGAPKTGEVYLKCLSIIDGMTKDYGYTYVTLDVFNQSPTDKYEKVSKPCTAAKTNVYFIKALPGGGGSGKNPGDDGPPIYTGGGGGGGRKTYTFDVAEVNKLIDAKCSKDGKAIVGGGNVDLDGTGTPTPTPIPNMPTDIVNTL